MLKRILAMVLCLAMVAGLIPAVSATPVRVEQKSKDQCCNTLRVDPLDVNYVRPDFDGYMIEITPQRVEDTFAYLNEHYVNKHPEQALHVYTGTEEDRENLLTLAQTITQGCTTNRQKADAIGAWLSRNINYDVNTSAYASDTFYRREGNCLSYANLMMFLLRSLGIPAVVGDGWRGDMKTSSVELFNYEGHAWCFVYLDGEWVLYDPLWIEGGTTDRDYMAQWIYFDTVEFIIPVTDGDNLPPRTNELPVPYWTNGHYYLYSNAFPTGSGTLSYFINNQTYVFVTNQCEPEGSQDGRLYIDGRDKSDMVMGELYRDGWVSYGEYHNNKSMAHTYAFPNGMMADGYTMEFDGKLWYMSYDSAMPILMDEEDYWIQDGLVTVKPGFSGPCLGLRWQDGCLQSTIGEVFLTYENLTPEVATMDDGGNVTAHAEGYAEFRILLQRRASNGNVTLMGSALTQIFVSTEDRTPDYRDLGNHTHDMVYSHSIEATCEGWGMDIYQCTGCVHTEESYTTEPLGHAYQAVGTTDPTCIDYGYVIYECTRCGDSYYSAEIDMLGHDYVRSIFADPTCTEEGYSYYCCSRCLDEQLESDIPALGHSYVDGTCTRCGETSESIASGTCGENLTWILTGDGTLTISGTGAMYDFEYMETPWYGYLGDISAVVIQDGITRVGNNAFREGVNITTVSLSDSITEIGAWAFMGAEKLTGIVLPQYLRTLEQEAFLNCTSLEAIELPGTLTFFDGPFAGCTSLKRAVIHGDPDIPSFMMGSTPFRFCSSLEAIEVDENHFCLLSIDGVLYQRSGEELILMQYPAGKQDRVYELAPTTCQIFQMAMEDVDSLEELIIPGTVQILDEFALMSCDNLHTIRFEGDAPQFGSEVFWGNTTTVYYPEGNATWTSDVMQDYSGTITWVPYEAAGQVASGSCGENVTWELDEDGTLTISGTGAMEDAENGRWQIYETGVTSVVIEEGVTAIGDKAFSFCTSITSVTIPDSVTSIGENAFECCYELTEIEIPASVTEIGEGAFMNCISLHDVTIPDSVTSIGALAFYGCSPIPTMEIADESMLTNADTGYAYVGLRQVHIGKNVSYIGPEAFANCFMLEGIYVDEENSFYSNDDRGVLFDKEKTTLIQAPGALSGHYRIPDGVTTIGDWAISVCPELTGVTVPASVTAIGDRGFSACPSLYFEYSTSLTEITFEGDAPQLGNEVFCEQVATVYYPAGNKTWTKEIMRNYGGAITWVPYGEETYCVEWVAANATLTGSIDLNFSAVLSENLVNEDTFVRFTCAGKVVDVPMADASVSVKNGQTRYRFGYKVYAKEMTETVTAQVMTPKGPVGEAKSYSVAEYCNALMAATNNAEIIAVCKAMLNYGAAAQMQFGYNLDNLANASLSEEDKIVAKPDASAYAHQIVGTGDGIKATSAKLTLDADVAIRVTFQITGGKDVSAYEFLIDGEKAEPVADGARYYIQLDGIAASKFDDTHIFSVGGLAVHYSVLSYVNMVHNSNSSENLVNLINALYAYYEATEAYVG